MSDFELVESVEWVKVNYTPFRLYAVPNFSAEYGARLAFYSIEPRPK